MGVECDFGLVLFACFLGFGAAKRLFSGLAVAFVWRRLGWSGWFSGFRLEFGDLLGFVFGRLGGVVGFLLLFLSSVVRRVVVVVFVGDN